MKDNKYLFILGGIFLAVLTIFVALKARNAWVERDYIGKAVQDRDIFTVSGEGKVTAKPDLARVDVGVYSDGSTVAGVQQANTQKMNAIITAIKALGVKDADIQTSNYRLDPKLNWEDNRRNILGYTLNQTLNIKVRNLDNVGQILQKVTENGANEVYGIQFTVDDSSKLQEEARLEAIADAKKKAESLADALGLKVIKVVTFSENGGGQPPMPYMARDMLKASVEQAAAPQIEAGSLDVMTNVSVTFEVR